MSEYGIEFSDWCEFPPETMVGETVYDGEGNAIGWITNATVGRETLTAEHVRECVKEVYFEGYSDGATHKANGVEETDWQAIANKLNATMGAGTHICDLEAENAKLRKNLKSLMMGTNAELCVGRDGSDCKECSMYHGKYECTIVDAIELLGIDMYGEPLRIEVDE